MWALKRAVGTQRGTSFVFVSTKRHPNSIVWEIPDAQLCFCLELTGTFHARWLCTGQATVKANKEEGSHESLVFETLLIPGVRQHPMK